MLKSFMNTESDVKFIAGFRNLKIQSSNSMFAPTLGPTWEWDWGNVFIWLGPTFVQNMGQSDHPNPIINNQHVSPL